MNRSYLCPRAAAALPCLALGLLAFTLAPSLTAQPATVTVDLSTPGHAVPSTLWGIFFEEINHAGEGGLYAELVQNRDFEATTLPEGWRVDGTNVATPNGWKKAAWFTNDLPGWSPVKEGNADGEIALDSTNSLNEKNPHSLRLTVKTPGDRCGVANEGFWGMNIQRDEWYDLTFFARSDRPAGQPGIGLTVSLESPDAKQVCVRATIPEIGRGGGSWHRYTLPLHSISTVPNARMVITMDEPGTVWLDCVSLFPRKTFMNRTNGMRPDIAKMLVDLHPGFLRFPGGCVVEGATVESRIRWKDSIGDISQRKGGFDLWGYYNTYGLGFHEYLQLAEDLGAKPMYVINSGQSCQARRPEFVPDNQLTNYVQESLDALQYAMGPADSEWGAKRAANGHPEPFKIDYVEIGNENSGSNYTKHYPIYYQAIKDKWPGIITIADTTRSGMEDQPMEYVDDHFYRNPSQFFAMADYYDKTNRDGHKIYVGEYAVNRGVGAGNLFGALSEAVFMLNLEKNSDIVTMASYAPLFENVNQRDWPVNLILYDSSRVVGRSSYQVQKMFSQNRPDVTLPTTVSAEKIQMTVTNETRAGTQTNRIQVQQLYALAGLDQKGHAVIVKVVNPTSSDVPADIALNGANYLRKTGRAITLANANPGAENTLDHPDVVVPVESEFTLDGAKIQYTFPPNSFTILRVRTNRE